MLHINAERNLHLHKVFANLKLKWNKYKQTNQLISSVNPPTPEGSWYSPRPIPYSEDCGSSPEPPGFPEGCVESPGFETWSWHLAVSGETSDGRGQVGIDPPSLVAEWHLSERSRPYPNMRPVQKEFHDYFIKKWQKIEKKTLKEFINEMKLMTMTEIGTNQHCAMLIFFGWSISLTAIFHHFIQIQM